MDIHFNAYKIKYDMMNTFFKPIKNSNNIRTMNIFINLDNVFHSLHRPLINNEFQAAGIHATKQLISNVFNLIGHYRQWASRMHVQCNVYAIYTSSIRDFKGNLYVPEYRKKYITYMNELNSNFYYINLAIKQASELMKVITNYLDGVYVIDSKYLEPSSIPLFIANKVRPADWNIMISRDIFDMQYCYKEKWSYISPRGDESKLILVSDVWRTIANAESITAFRQPPNNSFYLFILAMAIVGDKWRNIPRAKRIGWRSLFNYIDDIFETHDGPITDNSLQIELLNVLRGKNYRIEDIENNLLATSIEIAIDSMNAIDESLINQQIMDIPDYENLLELNNRQFAKFPINLSFLTNEYNTAATYKDGAFRL